MFKKPKPTVRGDLSAILKFLEESNYDIKELIRLLNQFKILVKREKELTDEKDKKNILTAQIRLFDRILKTYAMFQLDSDINGERIKAIAKMLAKKSLKVKVSDELIKKVHTAEEWTYDW